MLVSQVFFATDMHEEHGMHDYYNSLPDFGARLNVAITGIDRDGLKMVSMKSKRLATRYPLRAKNLYPFWSKPFSRRRVTPFALVRQADGNNTSTKIIKNCSKILRVTC